MKQALALAAPFGLIYAITGLFAQEKGAPETMEQSLSAIIKLNKKMEKITFRTVSGEKKTQEEIGGAMRL